MRRHFATMVTVVVVGSLLQSRAAAQEPPAFSRVRPTDPQARALLLDAWRSSPSVRELVQALEASDLIVQINALGLEPQVQKTFGLRVINPVWTIGGAVENILVRLSGFNPEGASLLIAHYDSTPGGPGAVDNGSGVVTFLEILSTRKSSTRRSARSPLKTKS